MSAKSFEEQLKEFIAKLEKERAIAFEKRKGDYSLLLQYDPSGRLPGGRNHTPEKP